jgi:hypothetical protein
VTRYCLQRDHYSCGPVALLNADKFFGRRVAYRHLPRYSKRVRCQKGVGTRCKDMSKVLGRAKRKSWKKAKQFLKDGGCIVVQDKYTGYDGHFYLIVTNYCGDIGMVNYYRNSYSAIHITPQRAARLLKIANRTWYIDKPIMRNPR